VAGDRGRGEGARPVWAKARGLFGLERKVRVRRSGNSLVVAIPRDVAQFLGVDKDSIVSLLPLGKGRLEVQTIG